MALSFFVTSPGRLFVQFLLEITLSKTASFARRTFKTDNWICIEVKIACAPLETSLGTMVDSNSSLLAPTEKYCCATARLVLFLSPHAHCLKTSLSRRLANPSCCYEIRALSCGPWRRIPWHSLFLAHPIKPNDTFNSKEAWNPKPMLFQHHNNLHNNTTVNNFTQVLISPSRSKCNKLSKTSNKCAKIEE